MRPVGVRAGRFLAFAIELNAKDLLALLENADRNFVLVNLNAQAVKLILLHRARLNVVLDDDSFRPVLLTLFDHLLPMVFGHVLEDATAVVKLAPINHEPMPLEHGAVDRLELASQTQPLLGGVCWLGGQVFVNLLDQQLSFLLFLETESGDFVSSKLVHLLRSLANLSFELNRKSIQLSLKAGDVRDCMPNCIVAEEIRLSVVGGSLLDLPEEYIKLRLRGQWLELTRDRLFGRSGVQ